MHGGARKPGPGKKIGPPKKAERFRHRMISLPPELDNRLIDWSIKTGQDISPKIAELVDNFLTQIERTNGNV